jgi:hypothetical protein
MREIEQLTHYMNSLFFILFVVVASLEFERFAEILAGVFRTGAEFFLNAEQLIVLGQSLRSAWCSSFYLNIYIN